MFPLSLASSIRRRQTLSDFILRPFSIQTPCVARLHATGLGLSATQATQAIDGHRRGGVDL